MSRRKKIEQQMEELPVDKVDVFLAQNYKKLLIGVAALLILFLVGYAFKTMGGAKNEMLASKAGQLEMMLALSGGAQADLDNYLAMREQYGKASDYIGLTAAELLVSHGKTEEADKVLTTVKGDYKELADGLRFDTGAAVNPDEYLNTGKMGAIWYYRAYLAADDAKKTEILKAFKEKYPENELLMQIERWNG
jgi:predicted negative regulator of RcsB-dependent stress response